MSVELVLARFDAVDVRPDDATVISRLTNVARSALKGYSVGQSDAAVSSAANRLLIQLPGGTAEVEGDHARFPISQLDPLTLRVIFEVSRAGDMVAITDGGKYSAILTDPRQRVRLPRHWQHPEATPVCHSAEELELLLRSWYEAQARYAEQAFDESQATESPCEERSVGSDRHAFLAIVHLHRFDRSGNEEPKHREILGDLAEVAGGVLEVDGTRAGGGVVGRERGKFNLTLPAGSALVFPNRAVFYLGRLDSLTSRVIYELARTGDMAIITCGPKEACQTILTSPAQLSQVPESWLDRDTEVIVCRSSEKLAPLLRERLRFDMPSSEPTLSASETTWAPGTRPSTPAEIVYLEVKLNETATSHQKELYRFHRQYAQAAAAERSAPRVQSGLLIAEFWQLQTPAGVSFYAYRYGGETEMWRGMIRAFAATQSRVVGRIANFDRFVQDDNRLYLLASCKCRKVSS